MASSWKGKLSDDYMKICSTSLITKEMQIPFKSHEVEKYLKVYTKPSLEQDVKVLGHLQAAAGSINWWNHCRKQVDNQYLVSQKMHMPFDSAFPFQL